MPLQFQDLLANYSGLDPSKHSLNAEFRRVARNSRWQNFRNLCVHVLTLGSRSCNPQLDISTRKLLACAGILSIKSDEDKKQLLQVLTLHQTIVENNGGGEKEKIHSLIVKVKSVKFLRKVQSAPQLVSPRVKVNPIVATLEAFREGKFSEVKEVPEIKPESWDLVKKQLMLEWNIEELKSLPAIVAKGGNTLAAFGDRGAQFAAHFFERKEILEHAEAPFLWKLFNTGNVAFQTKVISSLINLMEHVEKLKTASPVSWTQAGMQFFDFKLSQDLKEGIDKESRQRHLDKLYNPQNLVKFFAVLPSPFLNGVAAGSQGEWQKANFITHFLSHFMDASQLTEKALSYIDAKKLEQPARLALISQGQILEPLIQEAFPLATAQELLLLPRGVLLAHMDKVKAQEVRQELLQSLNPEGKSRAQEVWWNDFVSRRSREIASEPTYFYYNGFQEELWNMARLCDKPERLKKLSRLLAQFEIRLDEEAVWKLFAEGDITFQAKIIAAVCSSSEKNLPKLDAAPLEAWRQAGKLFTPSPTQIALLQPEAALALLESVRNISGLFLNVTLLDLLRYPRPFLLQHFHLVCFEEQMKLLQIFEEDEIRQVILSVSPKCLSSQEFPFERVLTALEDLDQIDAVALHSPLASLNVCEKAPWKIWRLLNQLDVYSVSKEKWPNCYAALSWYNSLSKDQLHQQATHLKEFVEANNWKAVWELVQSVDGYSRSFLLAPFHLKTNFSKPELVMALFFDDTSRIKMMILEGQMDVSLAKAITALLSDPQLPQEARQRILTFADEVKAGVNVGSPLLNLQDQYNDKTYADVTLQLGQEKIAAHKALLRLSPFFKGREQFSEEEAPLAKCHLKWLYNRLTFSEIIRPEVQALLREDPLTFANMSEEDFTILGQEGGEIKVHRFILDSIPYFRAVLRNGMQEAQQSRIQIQNFKQMTVAAVMHYIYTGEKPSFKNEDFEKALDYFNIE